MNAGERSRREASTSSSSSPPPSPRTAFGSSATNDPNDDHGRGHGGPSRSNSPAFGASTNGANGVWCERAFGSFVDDARSRRSPRAWAYDDASIGGATGHADGHANGLGDAPAGSYENPDSVRTWSSSEGGARGVSGLHSSQQSSAAAKMDRRAASNGSGSEPRSVARSPWERSRRWGITRARRTRTSGRRRYTRWRPGTGLAGEETLGDAAPPGGNRARRGRIRGWRGRNDRPSGTSSGRRRTGRSEGVGSPRGSPRGSTRGFATRRV